MKYKGSIFKNSKLNPQQALEYGFVNKGNSFFYETKLMDGEFVLNLSVSKGAEIDYNVIETATGEEYELIHAVNAQGKFVGRMKEEFESVLAEIKSKCFDLDVFKSEYARKIIEYINKKYSDKAEYLWEKFPNNAIFRKPESQKWYAAILTVKKNSIGLEEDGEIEVIDLKAEPERIKTIVDGTKYLPGFHMNKKHWFTIKLDKTVPISEICCLIDESREIV